MAFLAALPAWLPAALTVASTVMSALGQRSASKAAQADAVRQAQMSQENAARQARASRITASRQAQAKTFEAEQLEQQAGQETAAAQRTALEERRRSRLLQSRALALAGASGAGATDPTVLDIISDLEGEGAYRAGVALYGGEERARLARMGATGSRFEGATALEAGDLAAEDALESGRDATSAYLARAQESRRAGRLAVGTTIFSGATDALYGKYGVIKSKRSTESGSGKLIDAGTPGLYPYA